MVYFEDDNDKLGFIYEMVFPYRRYNLNIIYACSELKKTIKNICIDSNKLIILAIARILNIEYNSDTKLIQICREIQEWIINYCLSSDKKTTTALTLLWGIGSGPHVILKDECLGIRHIMDEPYPFLTVLNIFSNKEILEEIKPTSETYETFFRNFQEIISSKFQKDFSQYRDILNPKYKPWFDGMNLDQQAEITDRDTITLLFLLKFKNLSHPHDNNVETYEQLKILNKMFYLFKNQTVPIDITWEQLCNKL